MECYLTFVVRDDETAQLSRSWIRETFKHSPWTKVLRTPLGQTASVVKVQTRSAEDAKRIIDEMAT